MGRFIWPFIKKFVVFNAPQLEYFITEIMKWERPPLAYV